MISATCGSIEFWFIECFSITLSCFISQFSYSFKSQVLSTLTITIVKFHNRANNKISKTLNDFLHSRLTAFIHNIIYILYIILTLGANDVAGHANRFLIAVQLHRVQISLRRCTELAAQIIKSTPDVIDS